MAHAIGFHKTGGPDVMRWEKATVRHPGPGEVRIRHVAVGLNFADTYFYWPAVRKMERAGIVGDRPF
ncbi:hypothetical protein [Streptomyces sp. NPDC048527]|uniref:hypothetical protein n=1 Tax=Streptomyces sp. NPDC048527 TaxID=3365568 RepID=UPI003718743D